MKAACVESQCYLLLNLVLHHQNILQDSDFGQAVQKPFSVTMLPTAEDVYLHRTKPKNLCQRASLLHCFCHWFFKGGFLLLGFFFFVLF